MTAVVDLSAVRVGEGLVARPATLDDLAAVTELMNVAEKHDLGAELLDADEILSDWQRPSFDLATDSVVVVDDAQLIAYGEVFKGRRADVCVRPSDRGRGLGSAVMRWTWEVSRARGGSLVGQTVLAGSDSVPLFEAAGYSTRWTSWMLEVPPGTELVPAPLPAGTVIRDFEPGRDDRETFEVIENAFREWPDRSDSDFDDWAAGSVKRPGFEPWQLQLVEETATDGSRAIVGVAHVTMSGDDGWIQALATRGDRRGLGLGRAVLVAGFNAARSHGATACELSTDSRTGALGVYEHIGMRVKQTFVHYAREV